MFERAKMEATCCRHSESALIVGIHCRPTLSALIVGPHCRPSLSALIVGTHCRHSLSVLIFATDNVGSHSFLAQPSAPALTRRMKIELNHFQFVGRLVICFIDSYDSEPSRILQYLSNYTRLTYFCTAHMQKIQQKIDQNFAR
jgi:hypothetical protein